ncbi:MAG: alpha/beta hydrolase [Pseudomonadota bacterium]
MGWALDQRTKTPWGEVAHGKTGSGPPLTLAHGWPWSSFSWHRVIEPLAEHYTVYWYDMPGFGGSEKSSDQATSLDVQGDVFAHMMDVFGIEKPLVIAHDFGGAVTLRAHLLHGREYEKLVLMNVVALSPWGSEFFDHVGRHVEAFQGLPPHIHEAVVKAYIGGALVNPLQDDDAAQLAAPWLEGDGATSFYRQFAQADDKYTDEFANLLDAMRCEVAVLWGEDDPWVPLKRGESLHGLIPGSTFTKISNVGHLPQLENAEQTAGLLLEALQNG